MSVHATWWESHLLMAVHKQNKAECMVNECICSVCVLVLLCHVKSKSIAMAMQVEFSIKTEILLSFTELYLKLYSIGVVLDLFGLQFGAPYRGELWVLSTCIKIQMHFPP